MRVEKSRVESRGQNFSLSERLTVERLAIMHLDNHFRINFGKATLLPQNRV
jgi:hypothetical protein